jgi:hypothetical protein
MQKLIILVLIKLWLIPYCNSQTIIDLKTLIDTPKDTAIKKLERWGIKITLTDKVLSGYNHNIQIEINDGKVSTIWIDYRDLFDAVTNERYEAFPYQVDNIIKPHTTIQSVIEHLGKPDESGGGFEIGKLYGWVKWNTDLYQLHLEINDSKIIRITIMEPHWDPGS